MNERERSSDGLQVLKKRISATKKRLPGHMKAWRAELIAALGGEANITPQRMAILDAVVMTKLVLKHVENFMGMQLKQRGLVNRRGKRLLPIVREWSQLLESMNRLLAQLGLDRVERDAGRLPEEWITKVQPIHEEEEKPGATRLP